MVVQKVTNLEKINPIKSPSNNYFIPLESICSTLVSGTDKYSKHHSRALHIWILRWVLEAHIIV